jgi:hypothetical protein
LLKVSAVSDVGLDDRDTLVDVVRNLRAQLEMESNNKDNVYEGNAQPVLEGVQDNWVVGPPSLILRASDEAINIVRSFVTQKKKLTKMQIQNRR